MMAKVPGRLGGGGAGVYNINLLDLVVPCLSFDQKKKKGSSFPFFVSNFLFFFFFYFPPLFVSGYERKPRARVSNTLYTYSLSLSLSVYQDRSTRSPVSLFPSLPGRPKRNSTIVSLSLRSRNHRPSPAEIPAARSRATGARRVHPAAACNAVGTYIPMSDSILAPSTSPHPSLTFIRKS